MTTMFGSVDNIKMVTQIVKETELVYKIHIDGAYGGFYYPFSNEGSLFTFENPFIRNR